MPKSKPGHGDPNVEAARVVAESTKRADVLPPGLETAWDEWSKRIKGCDDRTMITPACGV